MDTAQRIALLHSLASTIVDYRSGEIPPITIAHVEKWLNQFDMEDQPVILAELDTIMKRLYYAKTRVKEGLRTFLKEDVIGNNNPSTVLPFIRFLTIQKEGSSQRTMLLLVDEILQGDYGMSIVQCGTGNVYTYIYMDDGIYTGSRLRYDLTEGDNAPSWITNSGLPNSKLMIYTIVSHYEGVNYAFSHIDQAAKKKNMAIKLRYALFIDNKRSHRGKVDFLWPQTIINDHDINVYVANVHASDAQQYWKNNDLFRPHSVPSKEGLFSSPEARNIVERAFLPKRRKNCCC